MNTNYFSVNEMNHFQFISRHILYQLCISNTKHATKLVYNYLLLLFLQNTNNIFQIVFNAPLKILKTEENVTFWKNQLLYLFS